MNTSVSRGLKENFKVFQQLRENTYKFNWGYIEEEDGYCTYDSGIYIGPLSELTPSRFDFEISKAARKVSIEEYSKILGYINSNEKSKPRLLVNKLSEIISDYDTSNNINQFYVQDIPIWLDKATRAGLLLRFQAEQAQGITDTALWYNTMQFPLKVNDAINMLYAIELYASACYDNTQKHLAIVKTLKTEEEIIAYDYKANYPEKLNF